VSATRLTGERGASGQFAVHSRSRPGASYRAEYAMTGAVVCRCAGFSYRGRCHHQGEVAAAVALEAVSEVERHRLALEEIGELFDCG